MQRQQALQAGVDLSRKTLPSGRFKHVNSSFSNDGKGHCYRSTSFAEPPLREHIRRTQYKDGSSNGKIQLRTDNLSIPSSMRNGAKARYLEIESAGCSIGIKADPTTQWLFPDRLQSVKKERAPVREQAWNVPGIGFHSLRSGRSGLQQALRTFSAESCYDPLFQKNSKLQAFLQVLSLWSLYQVSKTNRGRISWLHKNF